MLPKLITRFLGRLKFPQLFIIAALLFGINSLVPDPIPLVDEALLAVMALLLASMKKSRDEAASSPELLESVESSTPDK